MAFLLFAILIIAGCFLILIAVLNIAFAPTLAILLPDTGRKHSHLPDSIAIIVGVILLVIAYYICPFSVVLK